jgi:hypothetical protein
MSTHDLKQLYAFESNIEQATKQILQAAGYFNTLIEGANVSLPDSRFEVTFVTGEAMNEAVRLNGDHVFDYFAGRLSVKIVTVRPMDQPSLLPGVVTLHEEWAAGVRAALIWAEGQTAAARQCPFTPAILPFYAVKTVRPVGGKRDLDPRWLEDFTFLDFAIEFGIRSDAWPI